MNETNPLPADVVDAIHDGRKIEAIKLLREHTGLGLAEAKAAVDDYIRGAAAPPGDGEEGMSRNVEDALPDDVVDAIRNGRYIEAVKRISEHRRVGLMEAKDQVDAYARAYPPPPPPIEPQGGSGLGLMLLAFLFAVLGYLAYQFLQG